jgi:hypothetical protein
VPVLSGSGDEDPWDADDTGPSDGTYRDTIPTVDLSLNVVPNDSNVGGDWWTSLVFSVSLQVADYFFSGATQSQNATADVNRGQGRESTSMSGSNRN